MSYFNQAIEIILKHEGGFVNDPSDPGGATNYGISLRWLKKIGDLNLDGFLDGDLDHDGDVDIDDIKIMTQENARDFYKEHWWNKYKYYEINNQKIATKLFDLSINMGAKQAHKLIQRACRACGYNITDDGIFGPITLNAINNTHGLNLMASFRSEAAGFYRTLIAIKPIFKKYENGWLKRAYS